MFVVACWLCLGSCWLLVDDVGSVFDVRRWFGVVCCVLLFCCLLLVVGRCLMFVVGCSALCGGC